MFYSFRSNSGEIKIASKLAEQQASVAAANINITTISAMKKI